MEGNAPEPPPTASSADDASGPSGDRARPSRHRITRAQVEHFIQAVRDSDQATVNEIVLRLSRTRRWLAPLAFAVGAFAMLFNGVKLLFTNWRLTLIQVLPAMWIWAAMLDLKAHVLHGKTFLGADRARRRDPARPRRRHCYRGELLPERRVRVRDRPAGRPLIRPAFTRARAHLAVVLGSGMVVGILLGLATVVVARWGRPWFGLSLGHHRRASSWSAESACRPGSSG